ncbi:hypothetical protein SAY86_013996 [Trapa natans]|uniref:Pentatricopeptide repeat-containing protein n=1 Tax=Trapa natans TaxID=22666 RepID=A0AAN7KZR6_TRANT|nr:hypothetical protein SAY86_013996 [Trapa natans]
MLSWSTSRQRLLCNFPVLSVIKNLLSINSKWISTSANNPSPPTANALPGSLTPKAVSHTLACYSNEWRRALDFFDWVETKHSFVHTTDTFNRMIDILGKFFEFELCWALIGRMTRSPGSFPNHVTFRTMFDRYTSAHLVNEAISAYCRLEEFNLRDAVSYYNLIDALCDHQHVAEAVEICFGDMRSEDVSPNFAVDETKIHNLILRGWYKVGWWRKCRDFWEEMERKGVRKDLHSYAIYMDIVCKGGKPWKAVKLYKEMKRKGVKLDVVAYNTVVRAIGLAEGVDFSIRLVREMREAGCQPNVVTYNTIIKLLCGNGRLREAGRVLDEMRKRGCEPNVRTFNCIFVTLEKPKEILRLFDVMMGSGVSPTVETFVLLMRKFERWGFLRPVLMLWEKMIEKGCSPNQDAYNALIDALVDKGMIEMARKYDQEMYEKGLSPKPRPELTEKVEE